MIKMEVDLDTKNIAEIQELLNQDQDLKLDIAENMKTYGGSFVKALSECVYTADSDNLAILIEAFPNYFKQYQPKNWSK